MARSRPVEGMPEHSSHCLNCGAVAQSDYCPACGQSTDVRIPTLWAILHEFLDGFFNFDSRIWRTIVLLVSRPGRLTNEYLAGRRARYLPPFRLYLVLSVVYFVLASLAEGQGDDAPFEPTADTSVIDAEQSCAWVRNVFPEGIVFTEATYRACTRAVADRGESLNRELADSVPLMFFVMIPLFAAGARLVYLLSGRIFAEHLFFLFHLHAFGFLVATAAVLISWVSRLLSPESGLPGLLLFALWLYFFYYAYRALRTVYGQGRYVTLLKLAMLGAGYLVLLGLSLLVTFIYTVYTL